MAAATASLDTLCVNSIRMLAVDAVNKSNSGHPGLPMGCAPMGYALWDKFLKHNPKNPKWFNRDRFVLSAGHGCMLQYALLHLTGYDSVTIDDIKHSVSGARKRQATRKRLRHLALKSPPAPLAQASRMQWA